jgi:hypothetical protein
MERSEPQPWSSLELTSEQHDLRQALSLPQPQSLPFSKVIIAHFLCVRKCTATRWHQTLGPAIPSIVLSGRREFRASELEPLGFSREHFCTAFPLDASEWLGWMIALLLT